MSVKLRQSQNNARLRQYQALVEVAESIAAHRDLPSLFRDLALRLQLVVKFDGVNVVLHDPQHNMMRMNILESSALRDAQIANQLPVEESPAGLVWQTQQPLLITDLSDYSSRYPQIIPELIEHNVKTLYVLPITSAGKRLGAIGFGSLEENAWGDDDQEFLQQVAKLVAVAVDNTLNFENASATETTLAQERDRLRLLLEINNAVVSQLDLRELLKVISPCLRQVIPHDAALLTLHDPESAQLRLQALDLQMFGKVPFEEGVLISLEDTPEGQAITSRKPVLVGPVVDLTRFSSPWVRQAVDNGVRSGCAVPLISHDRTLGALSVVSLSEDAFNEADAELLGQCASQIAIAVENALNFELARGAEQELARKLNHLRLMLQVTTAVVSQLDLRELLQVISTSIREGMGADTAGVGLYDHESGQLRAFATELPDGPGFLIPLEGSTGGMAFTTGQPVFLDKPDLARFHSDFMRRVFEDGYRSGGSIPLIAQGRKLGVLGVANKRENAFSDDDKELLVQVANQVAIAVDNALNFERARKAEQEATRQSDHLSTVLQINNAVVSQLDLHELLQVVSRSLRKTVRNDTTGVALYDPETNKLRMVMTDFPEQMDLVEENNLISLEGSAMGLAFTSGEPVFLDHFDLERFPSDFTRRSYEAGLRSAYNIPLIAHGRKLGALGVASKRPSAFSAEDRELLCQSANQIAIAVENALNFERTRAAEEEAKRQSERRQLLLEINNAVVSHLDLRSLMQIISASLRRISRHDVVGLALYDPDTNQLRAYAYDSLDKQFAIEEGTPIPLENSLSGSSFTTGQPVFHDRIDEERFQSDFSKRFRAAGLKSGGVVPLIAHGRKLGTLSVATYREANLSEDEKELLCQVANQVAIAVENALAFREIETLKNKLASEKHYLEGEIRTEHNFDELIGESQTFKRILKQVETVAPTDSTVLICGETGTDKELIARAIHDLSGRGNVLTGDLPGGWKQRVAFGAAIMHEPSVLFLDEPTSGVDPLARRTFWRMINQLADRGVAVLVTTHYLEEAEQCNRLGFMVAGELVARGTPTGIKAAQQGHLIELITDAPQRAADLLKGGIDRWRVSLFGDRLYMIVDEDVNAGISRINQRLALAVVATIHLCARQFTDISCGAIGAGQAARRDYGGGCKYRERLG